MQLPQRIHKVLNLATEPGGRITFSLFKSATSGNVKAATRPRAPPINARLPESNLSSLYKEPEIKLLISEIVI